MAKLIVNPGTPDAFELELQSGINSLGRAAENDLPINHASVAERHCEILVGDSEVTLFDLASGNDTFANGQRIEQAILADGQHIQVGQVVLQFCGGPAAYRPPAPTPAGIPVATTCRFHPKSPARFVCAKCGKAYCELCVGRQMIQGHSRVTCRQCGSPCAELTIITEVIRPRPFAELARAAFKYPLQQDGWVLLTAGTLFYLFLSFIERLAGFAGPYGFMGAIAVAVFGAGYLVAYVQKIVAGSALGEERMPDWPDFENWQEDIVAPLLQTLGIVAFCLWPAVLGNYVLPTETSLGMAAWLIAWGLGLAYLPMAMLAVYMADSITALNPLIVIPAIVRVRGQYAIACLLLGVIVLAGGFLSSALQALLPVPVLPALLAGFASLYFLTVQMRILGLIHWCNRERLGWVKL